MKKCKKGEQIATLENNFCMKSDCIHYFEDNCSLSYTRGNERLMIYPLNLENETEEVERECRYYRKGLCYLYFEDVEEGVSF